MISSQLQAAKMPSRRAARVLSPEQRRAQRLLSVLRHRWAVPILAELGRTRGSKFATLLVRLEVSRESLSRTLAALTEAGWVMRNPGYGHPLRPEYLLTRKGARLAPLCAETLAGLRRISRDPGDLRQLHEVALRKWSLAILHTLAGGWLRFSELKALLPGITGRALTLALKELQAAALVEREVTQQYPPATLYRLGERGRGFLRRR